MSNPLLDTSALPRFAELAPDQVVPALSELIAEHRQKLDSLLAEAQPRIEEQREALRILGSVPSDQLLALEVIWQPEGAGEVLSADELITAYPDLRHL